MHSTLRKDCIMRFKSIINKKVLRFNRYLQLQYKTMGISVPAINSVHTLNLYGNWIVFNVTIFSKTLFFAEQRHLKSWETASAQLVGNREGFHIFENTLKWSESRLSTCLDFFRLMKNCRIRCCENEEHVFVDQVNDLKVSWSFQKSQMPQDVLKCAAAFYSNL